jgi:hypothetical protein
VSRLEKLRGLRYVVDSNNTIAPDRGLGKYRHCRHLIGYFALDAMEPPEDGFRDFPSPIQPRCGRCDEGAEAS